MTHIRGYVPNDRIGYLKLGKIVSSSKKYVVIHVKYVNTYYGGIKKIHPNNI